MAKFVIDTNLYIHATRDDRWSVELEGFFSSCTPWVYLHSVVAAELLAGALSSRQRERTQHRFILPFERRGRVITPSHAAWKNAAVALADLVQKRKVSPNGIRRSLMNDLLIAASAHEQGFVLVTENERDFQLIRSVLPHQCVLPWPDCSPT